MKQRYQYIDAAKGIGILLIVLGHVSYQWSVVSETASWFKISLFYVISGYLQSLSTKELSLKHKAKSLLVPYAFYSALCLAMSAGIGLLKGIDVQNIGANIIQTITLRGLSTLWFLPSLFIAVLLHKFISSKSTVRAVILTVIPVLFLFSDKWFVLRTGRGVSMRFAAYCISLTLLKGIAAYWFYEISFLLMPKLLKCEEQKKTAVRTLAAVMTVLCTVSAVLLKSPHIDFNNLRIGTYPALYFLFGIVFSFGIIIFLEMLSFHSKFLCFFGENSLFVMCTHLPLAVAAVSVKLTKVLLRMQEPKGIRYVIFVSAAMAVVCAAEMAMILIWRKIKPILLKNRICSFCKYI